MEGLVKSLILLTIGSLLFGSLSVNAASGKKKDSIEEISRDAYIWGYPAVLMAHARESMLEKTKESKNSVNHFINSKKTSARFLEQLTPVNPENLYSWAWIDLSKEPLVMAHPQMDDRFYSVQFVDAYSNVFYTISNVTQGEKANIFVITAPGWKGDLPANTIQIRAPTPEALILAQTFLGSAQLTPTSAKLATQHELIPLSSWNSAVQADSVQRIYPDVPLNINKNLAAGGLKFYQELSRIVIKNPPPTRAEAIEAKRFNAIGLNDKAEFIKLNSNPENRKRLERGMFDGEREIQGRLALGFGAKINNWSYEPKFSPFNEDYLLRASTSQRSLFSSPPEESLQLSLDVDSEARQLTSLYPYVLHFSKNDFPPARKMWSVRAHEMKASSFDQLPRAVSLINEKTAKLKYNKDGSMDIYVQSKKPSPANRSNWLPLPRNANFYVVLTLFNPSNSVLNRKYVAPSMIRTDESERPKQHITHTMIAAE